MRESAMMSDDDDYDDSDTVTSDGEEEEEDDMSSGDLAAVDGDSLDGSTSMHNLLLERHRLKDATESNRSTAPPSEVSTTGSGPRLSSKKVLGFEPDFLAEILCPVRDMCNRRFELSIEDVVLLGVPVHALQDGLWRRKESAKKVESPLDMFHVVFVVDERQSAETLDQIYDGVLTPLVRSLRNAQASDNYMWTEIQTLLQIRESDSTDTPAAQPNGNGSGSDVGSGAGVKQLAQPRPPNDMSLWQRMKAESGLATALETIYTQISTNKIADVVINRKRHFFQVPVYDQLTFVPGLDQSQSSGAFLSTLLPLSDLSLDGDGKEHGENFESLSSQAHAILLLDEAETLVRDGLIDSSSHWLTLVRNMTPFHSIGELAKISGLEVRQVVELAEFLINWRRARAIAPISLRNVYAVSPLAPCEDLYQHYTAFSDRFPMMPPLPRFLAQLSSTTKPTSYAWHIPSRDHKNMYLDALIWLIRRGFVTHLRTFRWVSVSRQIKMDVRRAMNLESERRRDHKDKRTDTSVDNTSTNAAHTTHATASASAKTMTKKSSPRKQQHLGRVVFKIEEEEEAADHDSAIEDDDYVLEEFRESLIPDPSRLTVIQRRWFARMVEGKPKDVQALFRRMLPYLNGQWTMERAFAIEGLNRHEIRRVQPLIEENTIAARHW